MERLCHAFEIVAGTEAEYDRMHAEIWPELAAAIHDSGYRDYTLYRRGTSVICVTECHPDIETVQQRMSDRHHEVVDRWNLAMAPFIASMVDHAGELFRYDLCWHLDPPQGESPIQGVSR